MQQIMPLNTSVCQDVHRYAHFVLHSFVTTCSLLMQASAVKPKCANIAGGVYLSPEGGRLIGLLLQAPDALVQVLVLALQLCTLFQELPHLQQPHLNEPSICLAYSTGCTRSDLTCRASHYQDYSARAPGNKAVSASI